jgi:hypothetical protein
VWTSESKPSWAVHVLETARLVRLPGSGESEEGHLGNEAAPAEADDREQSARNRLIYGDRLLLKFTRSKGLTIDLHVGIETAPPDEGIDAKTALEAAVARLGPSTICNAIDPYGWIIQIELDARGPKKFRPLQRPELTSSPK